MSDRIELSTIDSLYGGYWNYDLKDFRYMINPYFPPKEMLDKMAANFSTLCKNYPSTNRYISELLLKDANINPGNIVITNGASELINVIGRLFVKKLAIPIPTFDEYINRLKIQGKCVSLYKMDKRHNFSLNVDSYITFARESNSDVVLFVRPNNPTGNLISITEMKHALDELADFNAIIVDESFMEFSSISGDTSILESTKTHKNLIVVKSLGKVYGVPGLRIGCAISGNDERIDMLRRELPIWNINSFAQRFIELSDNYREEFRESCLKTVSATQKLYAELSRLECLQPYTTEANFILCELTNNARSSDLVKSLFDNFGILIYDCSRKIGLDSHFIRIASRTDEENCDLVAAIRAWEESQT